MAATKKAPKKVTKSVKQTSSPEIPSPQIGDFVNFFPGEHDSAARANNCDQLVGIVTNVFTGSQINLRVFQDGNDNPLWRTSIKHISLADKYSSYWDFRH